MRKNYSIEVIVFVSGAIIMVLELSASRILAPYLGSNIIVWTTIIGVILGSLSIGYWLGGKLSDKNSSLKVLSYVLLLASINIFLISLFHNRLLESFSFLSDIRLKSLVANILLFAPPSILLGMVSPYAIKLRLKDVKKSGQIAGNLYAIATVGSIFGTFLGGFFLIPSFGSNKILTLLSLLLFLLVLVANISTWKNMFYRLLLLLTIIFVLLPPHHQGFVLDSDTQYNRVLVRDITIPHSGKTIRTLNLNGWSKTSFSSAIFLDDNSKLVQPYTNYYDIFDYFNLEANRALMIGGGAFVYAQHYLNKFPEKSIDFVEIDPELQNIAFKYFGLQRNKRLRIYNNDGRAFLNDNKNKYDAIMLDVFYHSSIPFQLTTREALLAISENLTDRGIVITNIVDSLGGNNKFFRSEYWTYKSVFTNVYLFPVKSLTNTQIRQNLMLVATKSNSQKLVKEAQGNPELNYLLSRVSNLVVKNDLPILTDDYAPVETYALH